MKNNTRKFLLALLVVMTLLVSMVTLTAHAAEGSEVYLDPGKWSTENTSFAIYTWDGGEQWFDMTDSDGDGIYECTLPAGISNIIFVAFPQGSDYSWDYKIAQSGDLTLVAGDTYIIDTASGNGHWKSDPNGGNQGSSQGTYTVAGVAGLCGSEWDVSNTYNDMTLNSETGLYEKTFTGIPAGDYECKVALDHSWNQSWGTQGNGEFGNYSFSLTEEQNVTITFDPATGTVGHVLSASTGADPNLPSAPTVDFENCDKITIYVGDSAYWNTVFVHAWVEGGSNDVAYTTWPGLEMEWDSEKLLYFIELPSVCDSVVFNDGNGTQSADLVIPGDGAIYDNGTSQWGDIKDYVPPIPPEDTTEDVTVYVKDDAGWGEVWIYYWNVDGTEAFAFPGTPMEQGEDGYYYATVPAGYWGILFTNGGDWQVDTLKQTPDLIIPTDGKVYLSNGHEFLYNEGSADDNNAWHSVSGGNQGGDGIIDGPADGDNGDDEPVKEMTLIQKIAKAILLFLRRLEEIFKGFTKK